MRKESLKYTDKRVSISEEMSHTKPKVNRLSKKEFKIHV